jgi:hypothetical protein
MAEDTVNRNKSDFFISHIGSKKITPPPKNMAGQYNLRYCIYPKILYKKRNFSSFKSVNLEDNSSIDLYLRYKTEV